MMKWIIGILITSPLWFGAALYGASEYGGEKVVLETFDERGSLLTTLWVVDLRGEPWLRSGRPDSTWLTRIEATPDVVLDREGERKRYRAEIAGYETELINYAMREKYGYADQLISLIHDPEQVVAVRLFEPEQP